MPLVLGMAGVTRLVDRGTGIQYPFLVVRFGGLDRQLALLDHGARDRDPVTVVDDAVPHQQQIPRLDERRGLTRQRGPFLVVLRRCFLDALSVDHGADCAVHGSGGRAVMPLITCLMVATGSGVGMSAAAAVGVSREVRAAAMTKPMPLMNSNTLTTNNH